MNFSFVHALEELGPDAAFDIANQARPDSSYLLNGILPERNQEVYDVDRAKMIVRSTMAGVAAMDSPYPTGGYIEVSTFAENTLKIANHVAIPEAALRTLQAQMMRLRAVGSSTTEALLNEALNFFNKVILQGQFDMAEYLRGQALTTGGISFTFNSKVISVDYGVPVANKFATRTTASTFAYGASASVFWDDVRAAQDILRGGIDLILMNSTTAHEIIYNPANNVRVLESGDGFFRIQRLINESGVLRPSEDARDAVAIVLYDQEGDLADPINGGVQNVKFVGDGYVVFIGRNHIRGYEVGQGSTPDPWNETALGYTHVGPTVEGGGQPGRWGRIYTPQTEPWRLVGESVANLLPVILAPEKLVIASTEIA